jgi:hypothetical protein
MISDFAESGSQVLCAEDFSGTTIPAQKGKSMKTSDLSILFGQNRGPKSLFRNILRVNPLRLNILPGLARLAKQELS